MLFMLALNGSNLCILLTLQHKRWASTSLSFGGSERVSLNFFNILQVWVRRGQIYHRFHKKIPYPTTIFGQIPYEIILRFLIHLSFLYKFN